VKKFFKQKSQCVALQTINQIRDTFRSRNVAVLTGTQAFWLFTAFLWMPYRSLFILELGATKETLGMILMIETLGQVVFQLPGGVLADRYGRKRVIVLGAALRVGSCLVYLLSTNWLHTAPALLLASAGMLGLPAMTALIAESLPEEGRSAGFAAFRTVTWMPMIVTNLLGGVFMDYFGVLRGVRLCMTAALVVSILSTFLRWRMLEETFDPDEHQDQVALSFNLGSLREGLGAVSREIWVLTVVAALGGFAMRIVWSFMVVYAVEEVGLTNTQWGLIGTLVSILSTLLTYPGGMLADRVGRKPCIMVSRTLAPLSTLGFTFSSSFWHMGATRALGGLAQGFGGLVWGPMGGPVWQALVADLTTQRNRGMMMGLMGSIAGVVSTPASWIGGYMYDNISPKLPFQASFIIDILGTVIFVLLLKEPERASPKAMSVETK
jgi:MFS family permease